MFVSVMASKAIENKYCFNESGQRLRKTFRKEGYSYGYDYASKIRNRVFCIAANKCKFVFEEKAKADNYIRYNYQAIMEHRGIAPVRSYYCTACMGWHVTSSPYPKYSKPTLYTARQAQKREVMS